MNGAMILRFPRPMDAWRQYTGIALIMVSRPGVYVSSDLGLSQEVGNDELGIGCFGSVWFFPLHVNYEYYGNPPLNHYDVNCDSSDKVKTPACMQAIHKYCQEYHSANMGIPQEADNGFISVGCFNASLYRNYLINP